MPNKGNPARPGGANDIDINNTNVVNCWPYMDLAGGYTINVGANEYSIERHLASFEHVPPYNLLWANWEIDKENYKKRLATIARSFPTYSAHDASHSEVILQRIEALLGEARLRLLSPTDAWLLLQCAYTHDLGMSITDKENDDMLAHLDIKELFKDDHFKDYLRKMDRNDFFSLFRVHDTLITSVRHLLKIIENDDDNEIKRFIEQVKRSEYTKAKSMFSIVSTHYFRAQHAKHARDILMREAQDSTLNGILPVRLRKVVAQIDYCHGALWSEILKLPRQDNGLSTDYIHPQFVAALLRLGDLLDLDSNRFNRYQIEQADPIPRESMVHYLKHMAITRLLVTPRWIDIEARYTKEGVKRFLTQHGLQEDEARAITKPITERSANALRNWISALHDDLKEFAGNWNSIMPPNMPGYIAALGKNDIYIDDILVEKDELLLRYTISPQRAARIIEGAELYSHPLTFIREIVQNSIDATKKQINKELIQGRCGESDPTAKSVSLSAMLAQYHVDIIISYEHDDVLKIVFRDYGIGITYDKLKQMRHIGAIAKSKEEQDELDQMDSWLYPTGEFGIGMQSVFTVADTFKIETFPRYEANRPLIKRHIRLSCPELGGDIVNDEEEKKDKEINRFGSDVIIEIPLRPDNLRKLLSNTYGSTFDRRSERLQNVNAVISEVERYIRKTFTDDIVTLNFGFATSEGIKSIRQYKFPRIIDALGAEGPKLFAEQSPNDPNEYVLRHWYISGDGKESVLITMEKASQSSVHIYYRGIVVSNRRYDMSSAFRIPGVDLRINIMCERASELLEINRDYFKPDSYSHVKHIIQNALRSFYNAAAECLRPVKMNNAATVAALRRFFLGNPRHMMIFYEIIRRDRVGRTLEAFRADFEAFFLKPEGDLHQHLSAIQQGGIPSLDIIDQRLFIADMSLGEALSWARESDIWYTDFAFDHALTRSFTLRHPSDHPLCAVEDNLSDMMDMNYGALRIIQDKASPTEYIKLYTLVHDRRCHEYAEFYEGEHALMCRLILTHYMRMYFGERDEFRKNEIGNYILAFPAIQEFEGIAVNQVPPETPAELIPHFKRFVVCPWTVEILSTQCLIVDPVSGAMRPDAARILEMVDDNGFPNIISRFDYAAKQTTESPQSIYRRFFEYLDVSHADCP